MKTTALPSVRCAIVLAGGDGKNLRPLVRHLRGVDLPKQYVTFVGTRSLLNHTFDRIETLIPANRVYTVLAQDHLRYPEARKQVAGRAPHTLVVQPRNRETGPGILLPLVHVQKQHPDAVVAVFPSDHFVFQEDLFMAYVRRAFETAEESPAKIVFLGAEPGGPEPEYGYILPDPQKPGDDSKDQSVKAFVEEPETRMAARLISLGALWNTMVMVFRAETLLHLLSLSTPKLHSSFQRISKALGSPDESSRVTEIYRDLRTQDFCKDLIGPCDLHSRNQFSVLSMRGLFWSDWGSTSRIFSTLEKLNALDRIRSTPWRGGFSNSFSGAAEDAQPAANF